MQHILFSVISAIIGINILVVSARQESNQAPEFEHYDVESVYNVDATPYVYKETPPTVENTAKTEITTEISPNEPKSSNTPTPTDIPSITVSVSPTVTQTITPTPQVEETGTVTPSPTPSESISPTPSVSPTTQPITKVITPTTLCGTKTESPYVEQPTICL